MYLKSRREDQPAAKRTVADRNSRRCPEMLLKSLKLQGMDPTYCLKGKAARGCTFSGPQHAE